jgi:hypothetical protein
MDPYVKDLQDKICQAMESFDADALHKACEEFTYHSEVVSITWGTCIEYFHVDKILFELLLFIICVYKNC